MFGLNGGWSSIIGFVQVFFGVVIGLYFWNLLKGQTNSRTAVEKESRRELDKLKKMRSISLTEPLAERTRPSRFEDVVGQNDGLQALRAVLCGPNPQHTIIYGPPGIGKTAAARLVLEEAKKSPTSPFGEDATFIEVDGATNRFDERGIADPLIGSVHDPIYQGAGAMGVAGIPQPKPGAVTKAHGGMLFIDEIGELHPIQINKLLKVLEDRKVMLESAYYSPEDTNIPSHIHDIFQKGLPADFRLVAATTRMPEEIPPAIRSRCVEVFFRPLTSEEIGVISRNACAKLNIQVEEDAIAVVKNYASNGREAVNMIQIAAGLTITQNRTVLTAEDAQWVAVNGQYPPRPARKIIPSPQVGAVNGLAVIGSNIGVLLELEAVVLPARRGKGQITVTGVVEEEELGGGNGHKLRRKSTVKGSVENVLTVLRRYLSVDPRDFDIHVNFPGGTPMDGPSAGVSIATAIYSAITGTPVDNEVAMTGEVSIHGDVKPVGGVAAKVEAARLAGAKSVLIPKDNWQEIFSPFTDCKVVAVERLEEILHLALIPGKSQGKTVPRHYSQGLQEISF